eukprot:6181681-Pleurochrysis_carterae.AAC.3
MGVVAFSSRDTQASTFGHRSRRADGLGSATLRVYLAHRLFVRRNLAKGISDPTRGLGCHAGGQVLQHSLHRVPCTRRRPRRGTQVAGCGGAWN